MASFYVAGRLWEDAEDRVYLGKEQNNSSSEGFVSDHLSKTKKKRPLVMIGVLTGFGHKNNREVIRKAWMSTGNHILHTHQCSVSDSNLYISEVSVVIGAGEALKKMEVEKGVIARFVIGRRCYALITLLSTS
ncbi:hypothetical protein L1887_18154 [Cichorium endivia]|nr:hypothetical protein L1887_18154 [Cichorium endivia]